MKRKIGRLALAVMLTLSMCTGAALAFGQPEAGTPLYCHGGGHHGGHHGGHGGHGCHGGVETCDWLFHACGDCVNVNCTDETHAHRCAADCTNADHWHYGVCRYADGTLQLVQRAA